MSANWDAFIVNALGNRALLIESPAGALDCAAIGALSEHLAACLRARGCARNEPVIVHVSQQASDIASLFGVWRAGAAAVPVHRSAPAVVKERIREATRARFSIAEGNVFVDRGAASPPTIDGASLIIFTSGSTGTPKGVVISGERFAAKLSVLRSLLRFRQGDTVLLPLQLTFIFGIWVSLLSLLDAHRLVLMPKFSVEAMHEALAKGATIAAVVPTMLRLMTEEKRSGTTDLRLLLTGGEPLGVRLSQEIVRTYPGVEAFDLFGTTETGSCDFCLPVHEGAGLGTIGRPTPGVNYRITGQEDLEPGGELQIQSPFGMLGYLNDPVLTAASYDNAFFRTGDLARGTADGRTELVGRSKDFISRGGMKIAPLELDALFAAHPGVAASLAGGVADARFGETIHVLIVPRKSVVLKERDLIDWAAQRLEHYKLPNAIHFVESLPVGVTGKTDRSGVFNQVSKKSSFTA